MQWTSLFCVAICHTDIEILLAIHRLSLRGHAVDPLGDSFRACHDLFRRVAARRHPCPIQVYFSLSRGCTGAIVSPFSSARRCFTMFLFPSPGSEIFSQLRLSYKLIAW